MNTAKLNPSARLSQTVFPILLLIACGLMLTACGKSRQPLPTLATAHPTDTSLAVKTTTPTLNSATSLLSHTRTPLPTLTPTRRPSLASILDPALTPQNDNHHLLAFTSDGDIFTMNIDGTGRRNITNHPAYEGCPEWSPDGKKLAFLSSRDGKYCTGIPSPDCIMDIYTINLDGSGLRRITHGLMGMDYTWSPDGTMMAYGQFSLNAQGNEYFGDVSLVNLSSLEVVNLTNHPNNETRYFFDHDMLWNPDGKQLVYASSYRDGIFILNLVSGETKFWTEGEGYYGSPQWSPDGSNIVFVHWDRTELGAPQQPTLHHKQIILVDANLTESQVLVEEEALEAKPQWSTDGRWIAYGSGTPFHYVTIKAIDMTAITVHTVLDVEGAGGAYMIWTPDNQHLIFSAQHSEFLNSELYQINIDGSGLIQLTEAGGSEDCVSIQP